MPARKSSVSRAPIYRITARSRALEVATLCARLRAMARYIQTTPGCKPLSGASRREWVDGLRGVARLLSKRQELGLSLDAMIRDAENMLERST